MVGGNVDYIHPREICIQQLGRVEEMVWLPYDVGLSAAAETLAGILKRVVVSPAIYSHFLKFLHVDIQSTVGWAWWDWWLTILLQCFDTVGWVTWPVKISSPNDLYCVEWDVKPYSTQSTGRRHTLSRPRSWQPNDVMSEIECAQLHSELFRRRHSTWKSHGLFAFPKHLFE